MDETKRMIYGAVSCYTREV